MEKHIDELDKADISIDGQPAAKALDIRVQPGGYDDAKSLIEYGKEVGVPVVIKELGN